MSLSEQWKRKRTLPNVIELKKTCEAVPSQWEGQLADQRGHVYIRYRFARLTAEITDLLGQRTTIFERHFEDRGQYSGSMEDDEMQRHLKEVLYFEYD